MDRPRSAPARARNRPPPRPRKSSAFRGRGRVGARARFYWLPPLSITLDLRQARRAEGLETFIDERKFLVAECFAGRGCAGGDGEDALKNFTAHFIERGRAFEDAAGVDVHVFAQAAIGFRVCADFDDGRNRGADHGAATRREERDVRAAGDQLADLLDVADVGETPAHFAVGHHIQEVKAGRGRHVAGREDAVDRGVAGLAVRAHGFFLLRGQPALGIAGRETTVTHRGVITRGLVHAGDERGREFGTCGAGGHDVFAADEFARFLEDAPRTRRDEPVERAPDGGIRGDAAGRVRSAADRADDDVAHIHLHSRHGGDLRAGSFDPAFLGCQKKC